MVPEINYVDRIFAISLKYIELNGKEMCICFIRMENGFTNISDNVLLGLR